jgi:hypothetical protein
VISGRLDAIVGLRGGGQRMPLVVLRDLLSCCWWHPALLMTAGLPEPMWLVSGLAARSVRG